MTIPATTAADDAQGEALPSLARTEIPPAWTGIAICAVLATAQVGFGGYQMGVGNQSIQIAFLKHWYQPWLYSADDMVRNTMPAYPSYFFRLLAPLLSFVDVQPLYLLLQMVTSFFTLSSVYLLSRAIFRGHVAALAAVALLVGGHLGALAGDTLYFPGFTHTFAALPLAVGALALAYRGRWVWAFALAGVLFNLHALTAAYALLMLGAALFADFHRRSWADWLSRAALCGAATVAAASPTLALMVQQHQTYDADWVNLMRVRSDEHSFPNSWWSGINADVPRFVLMTALFGLSWSFPPARRGEGHARWITAWMTAAVIGLFIAGYVFTELHPVPFIIRLQPFRASRLLMILMLVHIAHAAVMAIRAGISGITTTAENHRLSWAGRVAEMISGVVVLAALALPSLLPLLPLALILAIAAALIAGHLSWRQGVVATGALLVAFLAFFQIRFLIPLLSNGVGLLPAENPFAGARTVALEAVAVAGIAAALLALGRSRRLQAGLAAATAAAGVMFGWVLFREEIKENTHGDFAKLAEVSQWARTHTASDAVFLTPTGLDDFRVTAERAIVTSWRDGTQLYFSSSFGPEWLDRMASLEPGFQVSQDGKRLLARGDASSLAGLDDNTLIACAQDFNADYIVLPTMKGKSRTLVVAQACGDYTVYEPRFDLASLPAGIRNPVAWNDAENFMATTVQENIEKYRKTDVTVEVVDAAGKPVQDLVIKLDQTRQAFTFGASLGFFEANTIPPQGDEKPAPVRPVELEKMPEIFNGSMIPFSSKWQYIEWAQGKPSYSDLDKYVDYCTKNGITMEFHQLAGTLPAWAAALGGVAGQTGLNFAAPKPAVQAEFNRHCLEVVGRYTDRIKYFQVENEKYMMQYVPGIFKTLQQKFPQSRFGVSDCIRFWDGNVDSVGGQNPINLQTIQFKGADIIDWLAQRGIKPDFFSLHGHHPDGLWADPQEMYKVLNYFGDQGLRLHISEMYLDLNNAVTGPLRQGIPWTPALQSEYLCRYLTVAFSHPDVDMVNFWGLAPTGWGYSNGGLIDAAGKTRPAWDALKTLFTETWRTHVIGRLAPDGSYAARTFQGTFKVTVILPDGKEATTTVEVPSEKPLAKFRLRLNAESGALEAN